MFFRVFPWQNRPEATHTIKFNAAGHRNLILNWGQFGASKTHAAFYFKNQPILEQPVELITLYSENAAGKG